MTEFDFNPTQNEPSETQKTVDTICRISSNQELLQLLTDTSILECLTTPNFTENRRDFLSIVGKLSADSLLILKSHQLIQHWVSELTGERVNSVDAQKFVLKLRTLSDIDQNATVNNLQIERAEQRGKKYLKSFLQTSQNATSALLSQTPQSP